MNIPSLPISSGGPEVDTSAPDLTAVYLGVADADSATLEDDDPLRQAEVLHRDAAASKRVGYPVVAGLAFLGGLVFVLASATNRYTDGMAEVPPGAPPAILHEPGGFMSAGLEPLVPKEWEAYLDTSSDLSSDPSRF